MELTKWEYKEEEVKNLQELGKQGWEAIGYQGHSNTVLLKRPCGKIQVREVPAKNKAVDTGYEGY